MSVSALSLFPAQSPAAPWQRVLRLALLLLIYVGLDYGALTGLRYTTYSGHFSVGEGLVLAALLCWGLEASVVTFIGAGLLTYLISAENGSQSLVSAACFGASSAAQVMVGAALVRRYCPAPLVLSRARDAGLFLFLIGVLAPCVLCVISLSTLVIHYGFDQWAQLPGIGLDFWLNTSSANMLGAPIGLALLVRPRDIWAPRRWSVGLPLLLAALLLLFAVAAIASNDDERRTASFEREAGVAAQAIEMELDETVGMLAALQGLLSLDREASGSEFLHVIKASDVGRSPIDAYGDALLIRQSGSALPAAPNIQHAHPAAWQLPLLRSKAWARDAYRAAGSEAMDKGLPVATEAQLFDPAGGSKALRVTLWQRLYVRAVTEVPAEVSVVRGAAFLIVNPAALLDAITAQDKAKLMACLTDDDASAVHRQLVGLAGCEQRSLTQPDLIRKLQFGGRHWTLRLYPAEPAGLHATSTAQAFAFAGLLGYAVLAVLLLSLSGRARHVETLVAARTLELHAAARELQRKKLRFRSVFEHAPVGVLISDLEGVPLEANPAFCRMMACDARDLAGFYRPYAAQDGALARQLVQGLPVGPSQRTYATRDGATVQVLHLLSLLRDGRGRPERLVCVLQDIADQLRLVEQEQARTAAERANRAKSLFLSNMSYELRTPLNGLLGYTQLLQLDADPPLSPRQQDWIGKIGQAGWHLQAMINDIRHLSLIETGQLTVTLERQNMHKLIGEVKALLAGAAAKRRISVRTQLSTLARHAIGDVTRIREILINLLSNAIKYNAEGGLVVLAMQLADDGMIEARVTDNGPGLTPEHLAGLFQPFNRLGQERGKVEGVGIGLVISRRLAQLMNGDLTVRSEVGKGSTFTLRLPSVDVEAGFVVPDLQGEAVALVRWSAPRRVVYVEHDPNSIDVTRAVMARRSMVRLTVYETGASALAGVLAEPPDLLLLDLQLPDIDGLSLLRRFRQAPDCANLPIVMISADVQEEHMLAAEQAGATHYITKPFDLRELLVLVDRLLAGPPPGAMRPQK